MPVDVTTVISAAGMGTRLGLSRPKALVEIVGKPLLQWQLEQFEPTAEVVVVAGYQAAEVVELVARIRPQTTIALNHDYRETGTAASLSIGAQAGGDWTLSLDGDLLVSRASFERVRDHAGSCLGLMGITSAHPVLAELEEDDVIGLSQVTAGSMEWTGLARIPRAAAIGLGEGHVFQGLIPLLPMPWVPVNSVEVDEPEDLELAEEWIKSGGFDSHD